MKNENLEKKTNIEFMNEKCKSGKKANTEFMNEKCKSEPAAGEIFQEYEFEEY